MMYLNCGELISIDGFDGRMSYIHQEQNSVLIWVSLTFMRSTHIC